MTEQKESCLCDEWVLFWFSTIFWGGGFDIHPNTHVLTVYESDDI